MTSKVEQRLQEIGVSIPDAPTPAANYLPFTRSGNLVFVSGQVPFVDGKLTVTGTVGADASVEDAQGQAKICAINLLAQLKVACDGDLDRVARREKPQNGPRQESRFADAVTGFDGDAVVVAEVFECALLPILRRRADDLRDE